MGAQETQGALLFLGPWHIAQHRDLQASAQHWALPWPPSLGWPQVAAVPPSALEVRVPKMGPYFGPSPTILSSESCFPKPL